jgi:hypothetical protein
MRCCVIQWKEPDVSNYLDTSSYNPDHGSMVLYTHQTTWCYIRPMRFETDVKGKGTIVCTKCILWMYAFFV